MKARFPLIPRIVAAGVLFLALGAALGTAQSKTAPAAASTAPAAESVGVLVLSVRTGSPAEEAGVVRGDILLEANGTAVNTAAALQGLVVQRSPGDTLTLKLHHGDTEKTLSVVLGTRQNRAYLGVVPFDAGMLQAGREGSRGQRGTQGAWVMRVVSGSPAEKAGLVQGDLILSVDGTVLASDSELADLIAAKKVGDTVTLSVRSAGSDQARSLGVTLGKSPSKDAPYLGIEYAMDRAGNMRGVPRMGMRGVAVVDVAGNSPAATAGIKTHDLITRIEGTAVSFPEQVVDAVQKHKPGDTMLLTVRSAAANQDTDVSVTLGPSPGDPAKPYLGLSLSSFFGQQPRTPAPSASDGNPPTL